MLGKLLCMSSKSYGSAHWRGKLAWPFGYEAFGWHPERTLGIRCGGESTLRNVLDLVIHRLQR